jgi:hypothetical protein
MSRIEISGTGLPGGTAVRLDGQDIINAVRGLKLALGVGQLPELELDVVIRDAVELELQDVQVYLPNSTRELLVRLGWTPPDERTSQAL